jgi:hypothetical protein
MMFKIMMINHYLIQSICFFDRNISFKKKLSSISSEAPGKHTAPVWQLYWVEVEKGRDDDIGEILMSISTGS